MTTGAVVSFRDADEPRALAARMIAVAHRHPHGWTVNVADGSRFETITFETVADAVAHTTGCRRLLIIWRLNDPPLARRI